jgi:dTDP-4-dehydrorhamnose reductase
MRILLLGKSGQVGWELQRTLAPLGDVVALDFPEVDLARPDNLLTVLHEQRPDVVINAAAYTAVDRAEQDPELVFAVNADAPGLLAEECKRSDALLIHYSTDYVFDGHKDTPYLETDAPAPLSVYAHSKLEGERAVIESGCAHLLLRTSWVYGLRGDNFLTKTLDWMRTRETLRVVTDQVASPTWSRFLAETTASLVAFYLRSPGWIQERSGLYHLAGAGAASRFEFARAVLALVSEKEKIAPEVLPALTSEFPAPAARPSFSALNCSLFTTTFGLHIPAWQDSLRLALSS